MPRILIVKTSSMGDIVHALPVVADIRHNIPDAAIDWVAEESFAAIPALHPGINGVIPVALRRWRKSWWKAGTQAQWSAFKARVQAVRYDAVLDLQGLWKSMLAARAANGPVHGGDLFSARDPFASLFYRHRHRVRFRQSAVVRMRLMAAAALGYEVAGEPDFGIRAWPPSDAPARYVAVMPSASRPGKLWSEDAWKTVLGRLAVAGYVPLAFAGTEEETARARRLIDGIPGARAVPRMTLDDAAGLLAGAALVLGLDSGLTHLAAALGRPTIGIYVDTEPAMALVTGPAFTASLGGKGRPPTPEQVMAAVGLALPAER